MRAGKKSKLEDSNEILNYLDEESSSLRKRKKHTTYINNVHALDESLISKTCRICLTREGEMKSIYLLDNRVDVQYANKITACANVKITSGDGLPEQICIQCVKAIDDAYSLKEMCEESNLLLRQLFKKNLLKNISKEEDNNKIIESDIQQVYIVDSSSSSNETESILKKRLEKKSIDWDKTLSNIQNSEIVKPTEIKVQHNTTETNKVISIEEIQQNICKNYAFIYYNNNSMRVNDYQPIELLNNNTNKNSMISVKPTESNVPNLNYYNNILRHNAWQAPDNDMNITNTQNSVIRTDPDELVNPYNVNLNNYALSYFNNNIQSKNTTEELEKTEIDVQDLSNEKFDTDISNFLKTEIEVKEEPIIFDTHDKLENNISINRIYPISTSTIPSQSFSLRLNLSEQRNIVSPSSKTFSEEFLLSTKNRLDVTKKKSLQDDEDSEALYKCDICGKKLSNPIAVRNHITWTHLIN